MKLKRRSGGHVLQREYYDIAKTWKKRSERLAPLGPFRIDGKDFVAITYFNRWSYYRWITKNGASLLASLFFSSVYLRTASLAAKTKGMVILDDNVRFVNDNEQKIKIARTALVWIDVYLLPAFPPRLFNLVDMKMEFQKRIFEQCKNRKIPKAKEPVEKLYLEQLKKADKQVVEFYPTFMRHHKLLKNATNLFSTISDKPSETKVLRLKSVMENLALNFQELSKWCEERARSWPTFVDSFEIYKESQKKKKSFLERYGRAAIWKTVMSIFAHILSGGNFAFSMVLSLISWFGFEGFKMVLSFRWQTRTLRNEARVYRRFSARINSFLKLYDMPFKRGFLR